jgi:3-oxoacyl-[acyl-carrier protein] reductase
MKGKIAVVTGAAGGIGGAVAREFADHGATVVGVDVDPSCDHRCDVGDEREVTAVFDAIAAEHGGIDILVNNAGVSPKRGNRRIRALDLGQDEWEHVLRVNLTGAFNCSRAAARHMIARGGGAIVNITSVTRSIWTATPSVAYIASKAGLDGLTRALAMELIDHGIRVNAVAPGRVRTAMTDVSGSEITELTKQAVPLKRLAEPDEIARAVLFLAGDGASYIVGATVDVSGGRAVFSAPQRLIDIA